MGNNIPHIIPAFFLGFLAVGLWRQAFQPDNPFFWFFFGTGTYVFALALGHVFKFLGLLQEDD